MRSKSLWCLVAVVALTASSACSSKTVAATTPCTQFRSVDAQKLLGGIAVQRVSMASIIRQQESQTTQTTFAGESNQIAAVDALSCLYRAGTSASSPTAVYQSSFV